MKEKSLSHMVNEEIKKEFESTSWHGSLDEFLKLAEQNPRAHIRTSFQYLHDMIEHFGKKRFNDCGDDLIAYDLFNDPFNTGENAIHGNHRALLKFVYCVKAMAEQGGRERILLLRGPVATAKTSIIRLLIRGLEEYSKTPEGGFYRFSWIFPKENLDFEPGFKVKSGKDEELNSYAHLSGDDTLKIPCQLNENPVMVYPRKQRLKLLENLIKNSGKQVIIPEKIQRNDLCFNCQNIYNFLLEKYKGDVEQVFKHVMVERFLVSEIDRTGVATVQPIHNVEGKSQIIAWESSKYAQISQMLKGIVLNQFEGKWADANRGLVHMTDLFKRNATYLQHLLSALQENLVDFNGSHAYIDVVIVGSTNLREYENFVEDEINAGLRDRMLISDINYILQFSEEAKIYEKQLRVAGYSKKKLSEDVKHICPHALDYLALWAVATRLIKPRISNYRSDFKGLNIIDDMSLVQKALVYDGGVDEALSYEKKQALKDKIVQKAIRNEFPQEGMRGISPRQIQNLLAEIVSKKEYEEETQNLGQRCLTIFKVLKSIKNACENPEFGDIGEETNNILSELDKRYNQAVEREVKLSIADMDEATLAGKIKEYVEHVKAYIRKENILNPITGLYEPPNEGRMQWIEDGLHQIDNSSAREAFRRRVLQEIGSAIPLEAVDETQEIDYKSIFRDMYTSLEFVTYRAKLEAMKMSLNELRSALERFLTPEFKKVDAREKIEVERIIGNMVSKFDYCPDCAKETVLYALKCDAIRDRIEIHKEEKASGG